MSPLHQNSRLSFSNGVRNGMNTSGNFCNRSPERAHNRKLVLGHTPGASFFLPGSLEKWIFFLIFATKRY